MRKSIKINRFLLVVCTIILMASCSLSTGGTGDPVWLIKDCAKLYTTEYTVKKVCIGGAEKSSKWWDNVMTIIGGERMAIFQVTTTVTASVDVSSLCKEDVVRDGNTLKITLPVPHIEVPEIKKGDVAYLDQNLGWLRDSLEFNDFNHIIEMGRREIMSDSLITQSVIASTEENTINILEQIFQGSGYRVEVVFKEGEK